MKRKKILTKKSFLFRSFRLPEDEAQFWRTAAAKMGVSQSEFLRCALCEKAQRIEESKLSRIVQGHREPWPKERKRLREALGVDYFSGESEEPRVE